MKTKSGVLSGLLARLGPATISATMLALCVAIGPTGATATPTEDARALKAFENYRFAEALQIWQNAADAGDPVAALYVGLLYDLGRGVGRDPAEALRWYKRSAEGGNAVAAFNAGAMYDAGQGTPRNLAAAARWYERAAREGMGRAAFDLGVMFEHGEGVKRNLTKAEHYYREAAQHGIPAARTRLAALGIHGAPLGKPSTATATDAVAALDRAQTLLLQRGAKAQAEAASLFASAAARGNPLAEYDLGYCYDHALGVPENKKLAYFYYSRAAAHASGSVQNAAKAGARKLRGELSDKDLEDIKGPSGAR